LEARNVIANRIRIRLAAIFPALATLAAMALITACALAQAPDGSGTPKSDAKSDSAPANAVKPDSAPDAASPVTPLITTPKADEKPPIDPTLPLAAKVNGMPIYQRDIDRAVAGVRTPNMDPSQLTNLQAGILDQIVTRLLMQQFLASPKLSPSKDDVEAAIDRLKKTLKEQNSPFEGFLSRMHLTEAGLRETVVRELAWRKYVSLSNTDDNLRGLFNQMHEFYDGTQRRVSHILFRPEGVTDSTNLSALRDRAIKLRDDITSGRITFEAAAEKYSSGPSRERKGDLGFIPPQGVMTPEFSQMAFALQPGEISQPIYTPFGFHLIKVTEVKPGGKTFGEVRDIVKASFSDALQRQLMAALRKTYADKVEYAENVPHFKPGTSELASPVSASGSP
jgi:parvulin-like peptidyl-prolyl isomerase